MMCRALLLVILAQLGSSQQVQEPGCATAAPALLQADQRRDTGEHRNVTETEEANSSHASKAGNTSQKHSIRNKSEIEHEIEIAYAAKEVAHASEVSEDEEDEEVVGADGSPKKRIPKNTGQAMASKNSTGHAMASKNSTGPTMPSYTDIDVNKDGVLTPTEFQSKRALEVADIEKKVKKVTQLEKQIEDAKLNLERQIDEMPAYEDLDRNKDGVVTPAEYRTSSNTAMAKNLSYKVLDGNADGAVTPENFKRASEKWAAEVKMQVEEKIKELATAREERRKLEQEIDSMESYEDLDKQRDGVITRSEYGQHVQAAHGTWSVESPAAATMVPAAATKVPGSQAAGASSTKQAHPAQKAGSMATGLGIVCLAVLVKAL